MIWRAKIKAALIHGCCTVAVGLLVVFLMYGVWYPNGMVHMLSGVKLIGLILLGEITLGPLLSFVVFDPRKSKRMLALDYALIIAVQLSALAYGIGSMYQGRPVYVVFVKDRLEVVAATELQLEDLEAAGLTRFFLPQLGPKLICVEHPTDADERSDLLFSSLKGKDIQLFPRYYRDCGLREVETAMRDYALLNQMPGFDAAMLGTKVDAATAGWLPVVTRFGSWVGVYPGRNLSAPIYLNIDPFGH